MTQGVSIATKKDGTVYYRAGLYYKNKHISLGSYADETTAGNAYLEALAILGSLDQLPEDYIEQPTTLSFEKIIEFFYCCESTFVKFIFKLIYDIYIINLYFKCIIFE